MSLLKEFVWKFNYKMKDKLTYNSYRTWKRNYKRNYDSVSVTEILWLIEDPNMEMVKEFYSLQMKQAAEYGTKKHWDLEKFFKKWEIWNDKIDINFQRALIENEITIIESEKTYKKKYESLPTITWDIDNISKVKNELTIIDYKISKKRNFKSKKYNLQLAWYRWLSWINQSAILYLNKEWYDFSVSEDIEYYDKLWLELLAYANYLFEKWKVSNLCFDYHRNN